MTQRIFPKNLDILNEGQQQIRLKSREAIEGNPDLFLHIRLIESSMDVLHQLSRNAEPADEDDLVIRRLGFRTFNSTASAVNALLTGFYQTSVMVSRDILEVHFLMDYLSIDKGRIRMWATCTDKDRLRLFAPAFIRKALDDRDGFTKKRREEHYKLLCGLGAHASPQGFRMLEPAFDGISHCGPFFSLRALDTCIAELAKIVGHAVGQYVMWIKPVSTTDYEARLPYEEAREAWFCRFYKKEPDRRLIEAIRDDLQRLQSATRPEK